MSEIDQYDYPVPHELIAQSPLMRRADARLLVVDRTAGTIDHAHVRDLPSILAPGDALVLNDSRVLPARLVGYRPKTRGRWQGLFLEEDADGHWRMLCKTRGKLTSGDEIRLQDRDARDDILLRMLARLDDGQWAVQPVSDEATLPLLQRIGRVPLPPYIRGGEMVDADWDAYQTVFAQQPGSVAAPTAGLHFTAELLGRLERAQVVLPRVTLHVGVGTFRPVATERLDDHRMHHEWGQVGGETVEQLNAVKAAGRRVVAVGTTVTRVLETAARNGHLAAFSGATDLFIRPPFAFHAIDALMTNFHYPRSTLLVLVRTFGGDDLLRRAYEEAVAERYRLFSYGDAMLIL